MHLPIVNSTAAAVPVPSGVVAGNTILVVLFLDGASGSSITITPPSGAGTWSEAPSSPQQCTSSEKFGLRVFVKTANGSDSGTYDFTLGTSTYREGVALRFTGADTTTPFNTANGSGAATNSATTPAVSVTTTVIDCLLVWVGMLWTDGTCTPPAGFTEVYDQIASGGGTDTGLSVAYLAQAATGSSGSLTGTFSKSSGIAAWLGALRPAGGGAPAPARIVNESLTASVRRAGFY